MSKRDELRKRRQTQGRQQQMLLIGLVALVAIGIAGFVIYQDNLQKNQPIGEIKSITKTSYPFVDGKVMGSPDAKVVLDVYSDFQCPYCGLFSTEVEPKLIADFVATGKVSLHYHHFIVVDGNTSGTESRRAAEASECAAQQGDFWNYHAIVFANQNGEGQGAFSNPRLKAFADQIGLDTTKFNTCFDNRSTRSAVEQDEATARSLGLNSTPTVILNNGQPLQNPMDYQSLSATINTLLGQ